MVFLGTQGDIWDTQKDMLLVGVGAIMAMLIVFLLNLWLNPNAKLELRHSLKIPEGDHALGKVTVGEWLGRKRPHE